MHSLIRNAVPFFFITSSFFIMKRERDTDVKRYWKRILKLYMFWSIINFIFINALTNNITLNTILTCIYQFVFNGYNVLWYLWGILIILPLLRKIKNGGAKPFCFLIIALFAFMFNRMYTHYGSMENPGLLWAWAKFLYGGKIVGITNICLALTYLSIGTYFSMIKDKENIIVNVILIAIGVIMMHFERHKDVALGVPVIAFGLFPLVKKWNLNCSFLSFRWLRKMSTVIYFIHSVVIIAVCQLVSNMNAFSIWCIIIMCCIILSASLLWLSRFKGMKWINNFC